jgi:preprotein translocase subunit SecD
MKRTWINIPAIGWYILGAIASLLIIFVWKDGLNGIRLGMDLAGGVRLTYHIDYTKYEQQFTNDTELQAAKQQARDIITSQIDTRISTLGVSNYEARTELFDGKEHMVIELGGVPDVDQAKNIIGKTVELEFALANDEEASPEQLAQRRAIAQDILEKAKQDPTTLAQTANRSIEAISYYSFSGLAIEELPTIYQDTVSLDGLTPGDVSATVSEGIFQDFPEELASYGYLDQEGYTITRLISTEKVNTINYPQSRWDAVLASK